MRGLIKGSPKALEAGRKARDTRLINEGKRNPRLVKNYNSDGKNKFRGEVIKRFSETEGNILTLESQELHFIKQLPNRNFIIFENNPRVYRNIISKNPQNVIEIFNADVVAARFVNYEYGAAFLDFCDTFDSNESILISLASKLRDCQYIAFTFCLRGNKKEIPEYRFDLIKKLLLIFPNAKIEYAESYKDGAPMVGVILKQGARKHRFNGDPVHLSEAELAVWAWIESYCRSKYGRAARRVYLNITARTCHIRDKAVFEEMCREMPKNILEILDFIRTVDYDSMSRENCIIRILFDAFERDIPETLTSCMQNPLTVWSGAQGGLLDKLGLCDPCYWGKKDLEYFEKTKEFINKAYPQGVPA